VTLFRQPPHGVREGHQQVAGGDAQFAFLAAQATRLDHDGALDDLRPQARAAGLDI
jgi:hypothetical protein